MNSQQLVFVGTYTQLGGKGIYPLWLDLETGVLTEAGEPLSIDNPSWLAEWPDHQRLFAAGETGQFQGLPTGSLASIAWELSEQSVQLSLVDQVTSGGRGPCHILVDSQLKRLVSANYSGGSAYVIDFSDDGRFARRSDGQADGLLIQHEGKGPNPKRQEAPHVHFAGAVPDDQGVLLVDLGLDQIVFYAWEDLAAGSEAPAPRWIEQCPAGSGPRHLAFHPQQPWLYAVCELSSQIIVYQWTNQGLKQVQIIDTLPQTFAGQSTCASIRVTSDGRWIAATNRGDDSIAFGRINPEDGTISDLAWQPCAGRTPRDLLLVDKDDHSTLMLTANQDSSNLSVFRLDRTTGVVDTMGQFSIPAPVRVMAVGCS